MLEESSLSQRIDKINQVVEFVDKMPFTSRYFCYPYILYKMSILVREYDHLYYDIKLGMHFNAWLLLDSKWTNLSRNRRIVEINEERDSLEQNIQEKINELECENLSLDRFIGSLSSIDEFSEEEMDGFGLACGLEHAKRWTMKFENMLDELYYKLQHKLISINGLLEDPLTNDQYINIIDCILGLDDENSRVHDSSMAFQVAYHLHKKGYIGGFSKDDLLEHELYYFIDEFISRGFFNELQVGASQLKLSEKVLSRLLKKMKCDIESFRKFNFLFEWSNGRFVLNKEKSAQYIIKFRNKLTYSQIDNFIDFCELLDCIYDDVDKLSKNNKNQEKQIMELVKDLVASMDKDGLLSEADRDRLQYFFEELLKDEKNRYRGYIVKKMRGNRNVKCWIGDVSSAPLLMLFGVLSRKGTLDLSDKDIQEWWMRKASNMSEDTYSRYFNGGKNETEPWTEGGSKAKENSEGTYEYIVSVAKEMMKINNKGK